MIKKIAISPSKSLVVAISEDGLKFFSPGTDDAKQGEQGPFSPGDNEEEKPHRNRNIERNEDLL